ncbi:MAG: hypothetical protein ABI553_08740 [Chloroflexota bacterium]
MGSETRVADRWGTQAVAGVVFGVILAFATSFLFLLIVIGPVLGLGIGVTGLRDGAQGRPRAAAGGGLLIGLGGVYLFGALNTLISCQGHEDVCGGVTTLPFLVFAIVLLALGIAMEVLSYAGGR